MADVRVRGAVSAKKSSKKRHKMVVTDDKVRVTGRNPEANNGDDAPDNDDFDDADDVDGEFDDDDGDDDDADGDGGGADVEAVGATGAEASADGATATGVEVSASAEVPLSADASNADANEPDNEPDQEDAAPMAEQNTPSAIVRPLHDRILVKRLDAEQKTPGGLFIPDNAKEKPVEGLVVAVGNGVLTKDGTRVPLDVKAGDRVLFSKYSGNEVKIALDGGEHLILREDDILAVLETP